MIYPIILAGGSGTRLWPLSRINTPKQFIRLTDSVYSLFQQTILRLQGLEVSTPIIICNEQHRFLVAEQLLQLDMLNHNIVLEPEARNTAPAITLGVLQAMEHDDNPLIVVLSADHFIPDIYSFQTALLEAQKVVDKNYLVTFGINTSRAETGYGYLLKGEKISSTLGYVVEQFIEKPTADKATIYHNSKDHFWNSGIFMFKAKDYLNELQRYHKELYEQCLKSFQYKQTDLDFIRIDKLSFSQCKNISIDYAVMEVSKNVAMVPLDTCWSDVGSWDALWETLDKDNKGNVIFGDAVNIDSYNNYIYSDSALIATLGIDNLAIVQTQDAILVANKKKSQEVKNIVSLLQKDNREELIAHSEEYRVWGRFTALSQTPDYKLRKVIIHPYDVINTQLHHHRIEHWIILSGTAKVTVNNKSYILTKNQSIYIPMGENHRIENIGNTPLEFLEIQIGDYISDDDTIRLN